MNNSEIKELLDPVLEKYTATEFIAEDPVSVPHRFSRKEDIEISGFLAATIAWGQRKSILKSCDKMLEMMDNAPFDFVSNATAKEITRFSAVVHRTFNGTDAQFFIRSLQRIYKSRGGLEKIFTAQENEPTVEKALIRGRKAFFSISHEKRTEKHLPDPTSGSACKKVNMFLRWMVRKDKTGIDFGLWEGIQAKQLVCPLDVHSGNIARKLGLLARKQNDWKAAIELTEALRQMDPEDPVKYDIALFSLGVNKDIADAVQ